MSIRRILPLIGFFIILMLLPLKAQAHDSELCDETTQQLERLIEHERRLDIEALWEVLVVRQEACTPDQARPIYPKVSRSPQSYGGGIEQWRELVTIYFDEGKVETALCLILYESTGDPTADNPRSSAAGLFQFLRKTWDSVPLSITGGTYSSGQVYDPEANVRSAAWLQDRYGWEQWSPYNAGRCRGL